MVPLIRIRTVFSAVPTILRSTDTDTHSVPVHVNWGYSISFRIPYSVFNINPYTFRIPYHVFKIIPYPNSFRTLVWDFFRTLYSYSVPTSVYISKIHIFSLNIFWQFYKIFTKVYNDLGRWGNGFSPNEWEFISRKKAKNLLILDIGVQTAR